MKANDINVMLQKYLEILQLEINLLGCKPTEIRHLIGRIGEFKCALKVEGMLAFETNQKGYDVISSQSRKVSVKTTAQKSGFITFNQKTLHLADDIMIIQYLNNEFKEIYFGTVESILKHCRACNNNFELDISKIKKYMN